MTRTFIGFDPGGIHAFGWCVLHVEGHANTPNLLTGTCSNAASAVGAVRNAASNTPSRVGIDSPMYWSPSGDRAADRAVRKQVISAGGSSGTVGHVNSLRGACLAQGIMAGELIRKLWPSIPITESHPKALLRVCPEASSFVDKFNFVNEHERDAAIGAYSALLWDDNSDGWRDLRQIEQDPFDLITDPPPAYWFPN